MLQENFVRLIDNFTDDRTVIDKYWAEIEQYYTSENRHYHTLEHLNNLLKQLLEVKTQLKDWDVILFTLFYHDIVYNPLKSDNEEKSAQLAENRMKRLLVPKQTIEACVKQILATKSHLSSVNNDINYFLDADLSVLGSDWMVYNRYMDNVRKEYSIYPDLLYHRGRKKVLNHFLSMKRIYKTLYFHNKFEDQAKRNLRQELNLY